MRTIMVSRLPTCPLGAGIGAVGTTSLFPACVDLSGPLTVLSVVKVLAVLSVVKVLAVLSVVEIRQTCTLARQWDSSVN